MNILLPIDGSKYTKRMLAYVAAHDEWLGARHQYTVVHVVPSIPPHAASLLALEAVDTCYADESEKVFRPIRTFFGKHGLQAEFVGLSGHAGETIAGLADRGSFDLLMMGSHRHGQLGNLVMGSVATRIVAGCRVPVLLVRSSTLGAVRGRRASVTAPPARRDWYVGAHAAPCFPASARRAHPLHGGLRPRSRDHRHSGATQQRA